MNGRVSGLVSHAPPSVVKRFSAEIFAKIQIGNSADGCGGISLSSLMEQEDGVTAGLCFWGPKGAQKQKM